MIWNRTRGGKPPVENTSLKVVFHPQGGFHKVGSFTEGDDPTEYERQGYLTLEVGCKNLAYTRSWGLERDFERENALTSASSEALSGKGTIRKARHGRYSLSFLGSRREHTVVDVSIRRSKQTSISLVPFKAMSDLDLSWDEHFVLDVHLEEQYFAELRGELRADSSLSTTLVVKLDGMRGLYATWSPSISEGRILKVLDEKDDVFNRDEMPEDFDSAGLGDALPFTIAVGQAEDDEPNE